MSVAKVLKLEDYRGKRTHRIRLADRLYSVDPKRLAVFRHLTQVAALCDADRAATVWVNEYGPGSVHTHVVLDQLSDEPRRHFSAEPLRKAWELGVPAAIDAPAEPTESVPATFAISLGSDGMRAWFLVAESAGPRPLLDEHVRDHLMFLAGECAAVVLHRELDTLLSPEEQESRGFEGWPILQDLEGRESDEEAGRRIAQRFVVGRVARRLVVDDLVMAPDRMSELVRRARAELPVTWDEQEDEVPLWHRVLEMLERADLDGLAGALLDLGVEVERQGHGHGAHEMYSCAYEIAAALGSARTAAEAARFGGGVLRRRAEWKEAEGKFSTAREIAEVAGLEDVAARAMVGLALIRQDNGNVPAARVGLEEALQVAEGSRDRDTIAMAHHAFMGLEQSAGNISAGLEHGWVAVATYDSAERRVRCMAGLAAALIEYGDREAAEDAWSWVAHKSRDNYYLVYAYDALSHLAALRGDQTAFETLAKKCDELDWESGSLSVKSEILCYRGLSYQALGEVALAEEWLTRALQFAEEHRYNRVLFQAEDALRALAESRVLEDRERTPPAAPPELREGLRAMRQELVPAEH